MGSAKTYKGVYLVKCIMAYFVVAIHTTNWSLMGMLETAVPYFFLASGFFLFRKLSGTKEEDLAIIRLWIGKVLKLYLIWTAIYFPFTVVGFFKSGLPVATYVLAFFRNVLFFGENYLSWPLWYLLALIWDGVLIYIFRRLNISLWILFLFGLALFISAQLFDIHRIPYYTKLFLTTRNGLFVGLAYVTAGGMIWHWIDANLVSRPLIWDILFTTLSFVGLQFSHWSLFPLAIGLFLTSLRLTFPTDETFARLLGSMSKVIYLTHMIFAGLFILVARLNHGWVLFIVTAVAAYTVAFLFTGPWKETKMNHLLFS